MRFLVRKTAAMLLTLLIISLVAFLAFQVIPGDAATKLLGTEATPESVASLREELGLTKPVITRYFLWLKGFACGDFGSSYSYKIPVAELLGEKIPVTASLSAISFLLTALISIPLGTLTAWRGGSLFDRVMMTLNQITMAIPPFFIGIVFTWLFGLTFKLFTPAGFVGYSVSAAGFFGYLIFPALAIALPKAAMASKLLRSSIMSEWSKDYVRSAYSRGNASGAVLRRHVLRNAVIPVVTFLALTISDIVAGSIIIEQVFAIPGMGRLLIASIFNRDYPVVQAIVVLIAALVVLVNFIADIAYQCIDPRIRIK